MPDSIKIQSELSETVDPLYVSVQIMAMLFSGRQFHISKRNYSSVFYHQNNNFSGKAEVFRSASEVFLF